MLKISGNTKITATRKSYNIKYMKPIVMNSFLFFFFLINDRILAVLSVIVVENAVEGELCVLASVASI